MQEARNHAPILVSEFVIGSAVAIDASKRAVLVVRERCNHRTVNGAAVIEHSAVLFRELNRGNTTLGVVGHVVAVKGGHAALVITHDVAVFAEIDRAFRRVIVGGVGARIVHQKPALLKARRVRSGNIGLVGNGNRGELVVVRDVDALGTFPVHRKLLQVGQVAGVDALERVAVAGNRQLFEIGEHAPEAAHLVRVGNRELGDLRALFTRDHAVTIGIQRGEHDLTHRSIGKRRAVDSIRGEEQPIATEACERHDQQGNDSEHDGAHRSAARRNRRDRVRSSALSRSGSRRRLPHFRPTGRAEPRALRNLVSALRTEHVASLQPVVHAARANDGAIVCPPS